jgi:hypothetical protein
VKFAAHEIIGEPGRTRLGSVAVYGTPHIVIRILAPVSSELLRVLRGSEPGSKFIEQRAACTRIENGNGARAPLEFIGKLSSQ